METIGERIKKMRLEKDWTQKDLALHLGLKNDTAIANYESNYSTPKDEIKYKLCKIFNCSMDYLMGESEYRNINDTIAKFNKDQYKRDVSNAITRATALFLKSNADTSDVIRIKEILLSDDTDKEKGDKLAEIYNTFSGNKVEFKRTIISILDYISESESERKMYHSLMSLKNRFSINDKDKTKFHMCPVYGKINAGIPNWVEECLEGYLPIDPNLMGIVNPDECFFLLVNGQSMNKLIRNGAYALIRKQDIVENGEICAVLVNGFEATLKKFSKQGDLVILEPMSDDPSFTTQVYNKDTQIRIIGKYIGKFEMNK